MRSIWVAVKVVLSIVLLAVVCYLLFMFSRKPGDFTLLGMAAVFFFMLALLWAKLKPSSRELGLVGVVLSFGFLFLGAQVFTGARPYPQACAGKRLWCEMENALHAIGGPPLAAMPFLLLGVVVLYISARLVLRRSLPR